MEKEIRIERFEDILTKRPEGMSYEDYRIKRKEQQMKLRGYNIVNTILSLARQCRKSTLWVGWRV